MSDSDTTLAESAVDLILEEIEDIKREMDLRARLSMVRDESRIRMDEISQVTSVTYIDSAMNKLVEHAKKELSKVTDVYNDSLRNINTVSESLKERKAEIMKWTELYHVMFSTENVRPTKINYMDKKYTSLYVRVMFPKMMFSDTYSEGMVKKYIDGVIINIVISDAV